MAGIIPPEAREPEARETGRGGRTRRQEREEDGDERERRGDVSVY